jgi:hypothetical protein
MSKLQKRLRALLGGLVGLSILILAGTCIGVYIRLSQLPPPSFELPDETVDYTYYLPPEAEIVEARAGTADIFGDFSMCASFRLSDQEMIRLRDEGLNWFPPMRGDDLADNAAWKEGVLSESVILRVSEMLDTGPGESIIYTYIDEWSDRDWHRLLIIDEESEIVYYCRETW